MYRTDTPGTGVLLKYLVLIRMLPLLEMESSILYHSYTTRFTVNLTKIPDITSAYENTINKILSIMNKNLGRYDEQILIRIQYSIMTQEV